MSQPQPFRTPQLFPYFNQAGEFIRPGDPPAVSHLTRVTSYGLEITDQSAPAPAPTPVTTAPAAPTPPRRRARKDQR